jgi:hypothetical protein
MRLLAGCAISGASPARRAVAIELLLGSVARGWVHEAPARSTHHVPLLEARGHGGARGPICALGASVEKQHPEPLTPSRHRVAGAEARAGRAPVGRKLRRRSCSNGLRRALTSSAPCRGEAVADRDGRATRLTRFERAMAPSCDQHHHGQLHPPIVPALRTRLGLHPATGSTHHHGGA